MLAQYDSLQAVLDRAAAPDGDGRRVKAITLYRVKIGAVITIGATFPNGLKASGEEEGTPVIDTFQPCAGLCTVVVRDATWSGMKRLYR